MIDFIAIANRVALLMGLDRGQEADHSPPIIWMRDSDAMAERFSAVAQERQTPFLLGMYWAGMIYLSLPDVTERLFAHECVHYFGGNEEQAAEIGEKF